MINLSNYRKGLIKGYQLAYQDRDWYEKNKNNFCNSLRNYPELIPNYVSQSQYNIQNFLGFNPDDLIRFGYLEKSILKIEEKEYSFWIVKIPKGFSLYHSSRALGLAHSDFPLIGYKNKKSNEENYTVSTTICPVNKFIKRDSCTYVTYYSTPYLTKGYLKRDNGYGGNSIKYAYGIAANSKERKNRLYNDRLRYKTEIDSDKLKISDQTEGVSAYITKEDTKLFILGIDDVLIDRPNLGKENMNTFYQIVLDKKGEIQKEFSIDENEFSYFLDLILSVGGIGSLQDNINVIQRDYPGAKNFDIGIKNWLERNAKHYSENPLNTAGLIKKFAQEKDLSKIPGFRFSTFENDRPVLNTVSWLFTKYNSEVKGFVSSSLYVYSKGKGDITKGKHFDIGDLSFYSSKGYFHSELGLFFAPDVLKRNRNNKYDLEYNINYLGIIQEYRKYKTTNLMPNGFHQGHLLEHNSWVGLVASAIYEKYEKYGSKEIASKDIYLLAGFLHDLGKSGKCETTAVYKNLNHQDASLSVCEYIKDETDTIIGMKYHSLPDHPDTGYIYLKGYEKYRRYTLNGTDNEIKYNEEAQELSFEDWENFFSHLKVSDFSKRLVRIAAGSHWYFGDYLRHYLEGETEYIEKYIRKLEIFYNDEFFKLDKADFRKVIIFVVIISISDILGSEYRLNLDKDEEKILTNYLPNVSLSDINDGKNEKTSEMVVKIIQKAIYSASNDANKRRIIQNIKNKSGEFLDKILDYYDNKFVFNPNNNFSTLYNLQNSYPQVLDIQIAYPENFPKVIAFDLDQTLLASTFRKDGEVTYHIYPSTYKVLAECQKLREKGVKIAVASRHYAPKALKKLLFNQTHEGKENPLYYKNFDFIVSRYTGPKSKIQNDVQAFSNFFQYNGNPNDGFMMDNNGEFYNIPDTRKFLDQDKLSKHGHFNLIKRKYGIDYSDILMFDDDQKYFSKVGLGDAEKVFVADVLTSANISEQGIRESLFKDAVAFFVFDKMQTK